MLEHSKNPKRLTVAFSIFILIIIVGLITIKRPALVYKESPDKMVETILSMTDEITPEEATEMLENDPHWVIIDIRNPYDFVKGHIKNAINIPLNNLLSKENLSNFDAYEKDSINVLLYGNDQTQANGPWMVLKQLGFTNVKIMLGGYDYLSKPDSAYTGEIPAYYVEAPKYDFAKIVSENASGSMKSSSAITKTIQVIPVRKKKKTVVSGGC